MFEHDIEDVLFHVVLWPCLLLGVLELTEVTDILASPKLLYWGWIWIFTTFGLIVFSRIVRWIGQAFPNTQATYDLSRNFTILLVLFVATITAASVVVILVNIHSELSRTKSIFLLSINAYLVASLITSGLSMLMLYWASSVFVQWARHRALAKITVRNRNKAAFLQKDLVFISSELFGWNLSEPDAINVTEDDTEDAKRPIELPVDALDTYSQRLETDFQERLSYLYDHAYGQYRFLLSDKVCIGVRKRIATSQLSYSLCKQIKKCESSLNCFRLSLKSCSRNTALIGLVSVLGEIQTLISLQEKLHRAHTGYFCYPEVELDLPSGLRWRHLQYLVSGD